MRNRKILLVTIFFSGFLLVPIGNVYGHGWGLDSAKIDVDGREVLVMVELPMYFNELEDKTISITAFDEDAKKNAKNVTFLIGLFHEDKMIFRNYFFTPDGSLMIHLKSTSEGETKIVAEQESLFGAYYQSESQKIELVGPVFASGGLFHFEIEIKTIDEATNILEGLDNYVIDVSIAETNVYNEKSDAGDNIRFRTTTYFDRISNFDYDPQEKTISFEMPFDWNEEVLSHVPLVHEEVRFPKDFVDLLYPSYSAKVNDIELFKSNIVIDDYTDEEERIVHFMVLQDHLQYLKQQQKKAGGDLPPFMLFTLEVSDEIEFPMTAMTKEEQFQVDLSWEPVIIEPGDPTKFVFTIRDGATGEPLRNSSYDFVILQNNVQIYRTSGNAQVGGDFAEYIFLEDQTGSTIIRFDNIRGTGLSTEFGLVVVPEFGTLAALTFVAAIVAMLTINRKISRLWYLNHGTNW